MQQRDNIKVTKNLRLRRKMRKNRNQLLIINLPIIICTVIAEIIVFSAEEAIMENYIAIVVAIIGVCGALIGTWFQLKKDTNKLLEVKSDTSHMLPQTDYICETTSDTNKYLIRVVDKKIDNLISQSDDAQKANDEIKGELKYVADEVRYRKRIEDEYRGQVSKDMIQGGIENLYKENALLTIKLKEYKAKNIKLERENALLIERNNALKQENERLQPKKYIKKDHGLEI